MKNLPGAKFNNSFPFTNAIEALEGQYSELSLYNQSYAPELIELHNALYQMMYGGFLEKRDEKSTWSN